MTSLTLLNIPLAIIWAAITGDFSIANLLLGYVISAIALWLVREQFGTQKYFRHDVKLVSLIVLFIYEICMSGFKVAIIALHPRKKIKSGFIGYPLKAKSDLEITLLANLITLTPGTLSVDVSDDKKTLYIHSIDTENTDELKKSIADGLEKVVLETLR